MSNNLLRLRISVTAISTVCSAAWCGAYVAHQSTFQDWWQFPAIITAIYVAGFAAGCATYLLMRRLIP